jgi:CDP-glucose 4,6-dehydratase
MSSLEIYKNKKVLITGNTGFKGSWLSLWLQSLGANVYGYSLPPPTEPNMFNILNLSTKIDTHFDDIKDFASLLYFFKIIDPEIVIHLAAQPIVKESYMNPKLTFETNVMGTINVLESIKRTDGIKAAIIITTDKVYEDKYPYIYKETDKLGANDPYSSSKACAEIVTDSYRRAFFKSKNIQVATARAGNILGGGDWAVRIIPETIKKLQRGEKATTYMPEAVRPWQFIMDPLYGYLLLGSKLLEGPKYSDAWNFGPPETNYLTVEELIKKIIRYWGSGDYITIDSDKTMPESELLKLDCEKSKKLLGWKGKYSIDETLEKTVLWYKNYYSGKTNMYKYTLSQIKEYDSIR